MLKNIVKFRGIIFPALMVLCFISCTSTGSSGTGVSAGKAEEKGRSFEELSAPVKQAFDDAFNLYKFNLSGGLTLDENFDGTALALAIEQYFSGSKNVTVMQQGDAFYDTRLLSILKEHIDDLRLTWDTHMEGINTLNAQAVKTRFDDYAARILNGKSDTVVDTSAGSFNDIIESNERNALASEEVFLYLYDLCSVPDKYRGRKKKSSEEFIIDYSPLKITAAHIDNTDYDLAIVTALQNSMREQADIVINKMRTAMTGIVNVKTQECMKNVDPYLDWYFEWITDDIKQIVLRIKSPFTKEDDHPDTILRDNYMRYFYPNVEMTNDLQQYLLAANQRLQNLAVCYAAVLEEAFIDNYVPVAAAAEMTGNDFMMPLAAAADWITGFVEKSEDTLGLNFTKVNGMLILNLGRNVAGDIAAGAVGGLVGGPVGVVIGVGAAIVTDIVATKASIALKRGEYKDKIVMEINKTQSSLIKAMQ